jgi:hypothetical protein
MYANGKENYPINDENAGSSQKYLMCTAYKGVLNVRRMPEGCMMMELKNLLPAETQATG